jgi:5S rRNA maturation endonuclease (ribonuclease M5)
LPAVLAAKHDGRAIYLVEGEKDADTLTRLGCVATTNPDGAGSWSDDYTSVLSGMQVDIIADNDEPGMKHGKDVASRLKAAQCDVMLWRCPFHKDVSDHLASGAQLDEIVQVEGEIVPHIEPIDVHAEAMDVLVDLMKAKSLSNSQKLLRIRMVAESVETDMPLDQGRLVNWENFIKEKDKIDYDWVIPGLLEISERVIVVAAEGVGKTMLARQVALLSAAGIHPFAFQPMKPVKTLFVDLENPERIIRRISRNIVDAINAHRAVDSRLFKGAIDAHLFMKPSGFDLLRPNDRALLEKRMEEVKPRIVCLGPLYKAFVDPGGRTSEAVATEVAKYLDVLRTAFGCALWLEHHAPLGATGSTRELRPFGSAVWSRWPEFGLSLQPILTEAPYTYEVRHFRGAREERPWPTRIVRGKQYPFHVVEYSEIGSAVAPLDESSDDAKEF